MQYGVKVKPNHHHHQDLPSDRRRHHRDHLQIQSRLRRTAYMLKTVLRQEEANDLKNDSSSSGVILKILCLHHHTPMLEEETIAKSKSHAFRQNDAGSSLIFTMIMVTQNKIDMHLFLFFFFFFFFFFFDASDLINLYMDSSGIS
jgi:hypothetical protein